MDYLRRRLECEWRIVMRIEDLKSWTVDQLKEEVVRLADERESK